MFLIIKEKNVFIDVFHGSAYCKQRIGAYRSKECHAFYVKRISQVSREF